MVVFNFQKKKKLAKKNISSNCSAVTSTTNRSNKNMLPQPIFSFQNFRDLVTIVNIKEYKDG